MHAANGPPYLTLSNSCRSVAWRFDKMTFAFDLSDLPRLPNYKHPTTFGNAALVVGIVFTTITTLVFFARLWARFVILRKTAADDYTAIVSYVCMRVSTAQQYL